RVRRLGGFVHRRESPLRSSEQRTHSLLSPRPRPIILLSFTYVALSSMSCASRIAFFSGNELLLTLTPGRLAAAAGTLQIRRLPHRSETAAARTWARAGDSLRTGGRSVRPDRAPRTRPPGPCRPSLRLRTAGARRSSSASPRTPWPSQRRAG